jgi:hypothetical protein
LKPCVAPGQIIRLKENEVVLSADEGAPCPVCGGPVDRSYSPVKVYCSSRCKDRMGRANKRGIPVSQLPERRRDYWVIEQPPEPVGFMAKLRATLGLV